MTTGTEGDDSPEGSDPEASGAHLDDIGDGCGCAEIWEATSERRTETDRE